MAKEALVDRLRTMLGELACSLRMLVSGYFEENFKHLSPCKEVKVKSSRTNARECLLEKSDEIMKTEMFHQVMKAWGADFTKKDWLGDCIIKVSVCLSLIHIEG